MPLSTQPFPVAMKNFLNRQGGIPATRGLERLRLIWENDNYKQLTFEQAYHILNPDSFLNEFEDAQTNKVLAKRLNYARVALSILPLILTWFSLSLAASSYQQFLSQNNGNTESFLRLWIDGFHNINLLARILTFPLTAFIDVLLLFTFLAVTWFALGLEYRARENARKFAHELNIVTEALLREVTAQGVTPVSQQADIDKMVKAVRIAIGDILKENKQLVVDAQKVMADTGDRVAQVFTKFDKNVVDFQSNVNNLTKGVSQVVASGNAMADASTDMAKSSTNMSNSSLDLVTNIQQIGSHLNNLNRSEQGMVQEIQKVGGQMGGAANAVTSTARDMQTAAQHVANTAGQLTTMDLRTVRDITNSAREFADRSRDVANALMLAANELQKATSGAQPRRKRFGLF